MKFFSLRHSIAAFCAIALGAAMLTSCGSNPEEISNQDVAELQKQLDSTMAQYQQLKAANTDFTSQLASRDSAIDAQAREIQSLISRLKSQSAGKTAPASSADNKQLERQQKEIREKENTIRSLQKQIDKQEQQIKTLQAATSSTNSDNGEKYRSQITKLEKQIASQQKEIEKLEGETRTLRNSSASNASNCDQMKSNYESQIASLDKQVNGLNAEIDAYKKQVANFNAQISNLNSQVTALQGQVASLEQSGKSADQASRELASKSQALQKCEADKAALESRINDLQQQVATLTSRADDGSASQAVAELQSQVDAQRQRIAELEESLRQKDAALEAAKKAGKTTTTKGEVNQRLAELQALCDGYVAEIERLRAENEQLKSENAELKDKVSSSAELFAENERLQQKVKLASVLVTTDFRVLPGKSVEPGNVVKSTTKAAQTKVVRLDCRVLDNNVIDPGSITIYARIANAANRVVCNDADANQSFDMNGVSMQYTTKQDIEFTGYGRNITMLWKRAESTQLDPGLYWVTLYANGYEIGKTSFKLD